MGCLRELLVLQLLNLLDEEGHGHEGLLLENPMHEVVEGLADFVLLEVVDILLLDLRIRNRNNLCNNGRGQGVGARERGRAPRETAARSTRDDV